MEAWGRQKGPQGPPTPWLNTRSPIRRPPSKYPQALPDPRVTYTQTQEPKQENSIRSIPPHLPLNYNPSPLPRWQTASPLLPCPPLPAVYSVNFHHLYSALGECFHHPSCQPPPDRVTPPLGVPSADQETPPTFSTRTDLFLISLKS